MLLSGHLYDDSSPSVSVAAGITVGLIASLIQSLGLTIQRKSHIQNHALDEEFRRPDYRRPLWLFGFAIFLSSNILGSIFQIASLPVVILAPLGAVSLLWNAFFARVILGDVFSKYMLFGTVFVVVGAVLIGIFGIIPEPTHSLDDLLRLFGRTSFVVYFSLLGAAVLFILAATHISEWNYNRLQRRLRQSGSAPSTPPLSNSSASLGAMPLVPPAPTLPTATEVTPLLMDIDTTGNGNGHTSSSDGKSRSNSRASSIRFKTRSKDRTPTLLAISYATMSGLLSGMCLIFAKSAVELLVLTAAGQNQFGRWESWILVLALGVFALLQLWYLHKSLTLEDPTLVCPLAFCSYNLSSILNGLIYFDQFDRLSSKQLGLVIGGIVILLIGVGAVSVQDDEGGDYDDESVNEEEESSALAAMTGEDADVEAGRPIIDLIAESERRRMQNGVEAEEASLGQRKGRTGDRRSVSSPSAFLVAGDHDRRSSLDQVLEEGSSPELEALDRLALSDPSHGSSRPLPSTTRTLPSSPTSPSKTSAGRRGRTQSESSTTTLLLQSGSQQSPRSPPRRRRGTLGRLALIGDDPIQPHSHHSHTNADRDGGSGSLSPPPLPGFSIGLSPLSPGFSLVPRHRDSSVAGSSAAGGGGEATGGDGSGEGQNHQQGRRFSGLMSAVRRFTPRRST